jgi:hypothetical protein
VYNSQAIQKTSAFDSAVDYAPREAQQYYNSDPVMNANLAPRLNYMRGNPWSGNYLGQGLGLPVNRGYPVNGLGNAPFNGQGYGFPYGNQNFDPSWIMEQDSSDGDFGGENIMQEDSAALMEAPENFDNTKPPQPDGNNQVKTEEATHDNHEEAEMLQESGQENHEENSQEHTEGNTEGNTAE